MIFQIYFKEHEKYFKEQGNEMSVFELAFYERPEMSTLSLFIQRPCNILDFSIPYGAEIEEEYNGILREGIETRKQN